MRIARGIAAAAFLMTGCSAFIDIDGFSDGKREGACIDCAEDDPSITPRAGDGGPATALEAGVPEDTTPPRSDTGDAATGPVTWCSSVRTTFCADFDALPLPSGFGANDGASLRLVGEQKVSAPNALLVVPRRRAPRSTSPG